MTITVNGKRMDVDDAISIDGLLAQLGVPREFTAVAVNRDVARRDDFATRRLAPGDRVEIVRPMGGG